MATEILVCPVCFRPRCPLFVRLQQLKFDPGERRKIFREHHRDVCGTCKRLRCVKIKFPKAGDERCVPHVLKVKNKGKMHESRQVLPDWWQEPVADVAPTPPEAKLSPLEQSRKREAASIRKRRNRAAKAGST